MEARTLAVAAATLLLSGSALAEQVSLNGRPFLSAASKLKPGNILGSLAVRRADQRS
jgi:hypothetical protein